MKGCKHPTCGDVCRRPKKERKRYTINHKPYKINKVSDRRREQNRTYSIRRKIFLAARLTCEIESPDCSGTATVIHHKKGREGDLFLEEKFWAASCAHCNLYVEKYDAWARQNGHKLSKHQKDS